MCADEGLPLVVYPHRNQWYHTSNTLAPSSTKSNEDDDHRCIFVNNYSVILLIRSLIGRKKLAVLSGRAQTSWLEGRNDKYTEHRPRDGGAQQMFIRGGFLPPPLPTGPTPYPFINHFSRKRYSFHKPSIDKWYPFNIPCLELSSLLTAVNTLSFK